MITVTDEQQLVFRILFASVDERAGLLAEYAPDEVGRSFLSVILETTHPSALTLVMGDIVRSHPPGEATISHSVGVIADRSLPAETRAACLRALPSGEGLEERVLAAGLPQDRLDELVELHARWERSAAACSGWWTVPKTVLPPRDDTKRDAEPVAAIRPDMLEQATELEVRRSIRDRGSEYAGFAAAIAGLDEVEQWAVVEEYDPRFVMEAAVNQLLECRPSERGRYRAIAVDYGVHSPVSLARLVAAVLDSGNPWDLRVECFAVWASSHDGEFDATRLDEWKDLSDDEWDTLRTEFFKRMAVFVRLRPTEFIDFAWNLTPPQFEELCDRLREGSRRPDWHELLRYDSIIKFWPRISEELAYEKETDAIDRLEGCVERLEFGDGRARVERALIRLRAMDD